MHIMHQHTAQCGMPDSKLILAGMGLFVNRPKCLCCNHPMAAIENKPVCLHCTPASLPYQSKD